MGEALLVDQADPREVATGVGILAIPQHRPHAEYLVERRCPGEIDFARLEVERGNVIPSLGTDLSEVPTHQHQVVVDRDRLGVTVRRRCPYQLAVGKVVLGDVPAAATAGRVQGRRGRGKAEQLVLWMRRPLCDRTGTRRQCGDVRALAATDQCEQSADDDARAVGRDQHCPHGVVGTVVGGPGEQLAGGADGGQALAMRGADLVELATEEHPRAHRGDRVHRPAVGAGRPVQYRTGAGGRDRCHVGAALPAHQGEIASGIDRATARPHREGADGQVGIGIPGQQRPGSGVERCQVIACSLVDTERRTCRPHRGERAADVDDAVGSDDRVHCAVRLI